MPYWTRSVLDARAALLEEAALRRDEARVLRAEMHRLRLELYERRCEAHEVMLTSTHRLAMDRLDFEAQRQRSQSLDEGGAP